MLRALRKFRSENTKQLVSLTMRGKITTRLCGMVVAGQHHYLEIKSPNCFLDSQQLIAGAWITIGFTSASLGQHHLSDSTSLVGAWGGLPCSKYPNLVLGQVSGQKSDGTVVGGLWWLVMAGLAMQFQPCFSTHPGTPGLLLHKSAQLKGRTLSFGGKKQVNAEYPCYQLPVHHGISVQRSSCPAQAAGWSIMQHWPPLCQAPCTCTTWGDGCEDLCIPTTRFLPLPLLIGTFYPFFSFCTWSVLVQDRVIIKLIRSSLNYSCCAWRALPTPPDGLIGSCQRLISEQGSTAAGSLVAAAWPCPLCAACCHPANPGANRSSHTADRVQAAALTSRQPLCDGFGPCPQLLGERKGMAAVGEWLHSLLMWVCRDSPLGLSEQDGGFYVASRATQAGKANQGNRGAEIGLIEKWADSCVSATTQLIGWAYFILD